MCVYMSDFKGVQLDFAVLLQTLQRINPSFPHLHLGWGGIYILLYIYDTIMPKHSVSVDIVKVNKLFIKGLRPVLLPFRLLSKISYTV